MESCYYFFLYNPGDPIGSFFKKPSTMPFGLLFFLLSSVLWTEKEISPFFLGIFSIMDKNGYILIGYLYFITHLFVMRLSNKRDIVKNLLK